MKNAWGAHGPNFSKSYYINLLTDTRFVGDAIFCG